MASGKSRDSAKSGPKETSPDTTDEEKPELCDGFKDVDAFVKVSEETWFWVQQLVQANSHSSGQRGPSVVTLTYF